ncbi:MAG: Sapep family Mn(2+)-dependent dipeptidase [Lachnospiraceae bacterium]|nr:Sapep family Mn(2+)-dependent dipeptidase [Lachnospiraceae bacterium]
MEQFKQSDQKYLEDLGKLIAIKSIAKTGEAARVGESSYPYGEGPAKALEFVLQLCDSFGFRTKNCNGECGYAEIGSGKELMGILVHLDTVPAGSGWDTDPFQAVIKDGQMYGRGVTDDKGPAMACIYAMKDILDSGCELKRRIRIIFGQTEEQGDWTDMEYYKAHEEIPTFGFTPDADFPAIYGEKGIAMLELSMDESASGFTSATGGEAPNMVADSCQVTLTDGTVFETTGVAAHGSTPEDGENAISGCMEQIVTQNSKESYFAEFYQNTIGYDLHEERIGCAFQDAESGELTFNTGMLRMGEEKVTLTVDIRYPVTDTLEQVLEGVQTVCEPYGVTVSVAEHMKPVYMDEQGEVIQKLMKVYREATGDNRKAMIMGGGTYARAMDGIVAFGPMLPGRICTEHQKNECLPVEDILFLRKIYGAAMRELAS